MNRFFSTSVLNIAIAISCVRVFVLFFLVYCEWTGRQSISLLPLVLLLYPEGLLLRDGLTWTVGKAAGFGALLIIGSFSLTFIGAIILRLFKN
jgi:hypothetical protein